MDVRSFYGTTSRIISVIPNDGINSDDENVDDDNDGQEVRFSDSSESDISSSDSENETNGWKPINVLDENVNTPSFHSYHGVSRKVTCKSPKDFFSEMFPDSLIDVIVKETNRYARNKISQWSATSRVEIYAFLGLILAMAIHRLPTLKSYWSQDWILGVPKFMEIFPWHRFRLLWANIHLVNNEDLLPRDHPDFDKLFKIRPVLNILKKTFLEGYSPSQCLAVDESMVRFKGRSSMKQYMPLKPIKRGFKIWCLSCSCCGYLLKFQMYTGKEKQATEVNLSSRVVKDLVLTEFSHKSHIIFMDNYFSGIQLFRDLRKDVVFCCGTLRSSRKEFPEDIKRDMKTLHRGNCIFQMEGSLSVVVWQDKKPVTIATNAYNPTSTDSVERKARDGRKETIPCPAVIKAYNKYMGGVDFTDQLKETYCVNRKSKRWWLRVFYHFLDLAVTNAFVLSKNISTGKPPTQLDFRCELIHQLVGDFSARKLPIREFPGPSRSTVSHEIAKVEDLGMKAGRCHYCSIGPYKTGKRKETKFGCKGCKKRLCPTECFAQFHKKVKADSSSS